MKFEEKRLNFLQKVLEKYPGYKVLMFSRLDSPMTLEAPDGTIYHKNHAHRFISHNLRFDAVVDKYKYIQNKLDKFNTGLNLINYKGMKEKVIVQDQNGFTYSPSCYDLLQGHIVTIESCNEKEDLFKHKANLKHNNFYTYGDFKYTNGKQKVPIICPIHGVFYTVVEGHLFGNGCPNCKKDNASFSKSAWVNKHKNKKCIFYVLEFFNDNESFIKVGVTAVSIKKRYASVKNYKYKIILEIKGESEFISNLEKDILNTHKDLKHEPLLEFQGRTECFNLQIKNKIYEQFKC
jgi:hypothetical protein